MTENIIREVKRTPNSTKPFRHERVDLEVYRIPTILTIGKRRVTLKLGTVGMSWEHDGKDWNLTAFDTKTGFRTQLVTYDDEPNAATVIIPKHFTPGYDYDPKVKCYIEEDNELYLECPDFRFSYTTNP